MRRLAVTFALLAIVLTACRVETNINFDIAADGSAVVGFELGYDDEFAELMGEQGFSPTDIGGGLPDFGDQAVRPIDRQEGDMTYVGVETDIEDLSALNVDQPGIDSFSTFRYEFDDDTATLRASIESDELMGGAGDLPLDPGALAGNFFSANVIAKMPGSVTSHNADEVRPDGALVWNIPLAGSVDIEATSDLNAASSLNFALLIIAGIALIGLIAAIAALIMSRRSSERAAVAAAAAQRAAADAEAAHAEGGEITLDLHEADAEAGDQPDNT